MLVIYRMCGLASTNPSPIYQDDKYKLNELCLKSFINAYSAVRPKMIFLLDYCGPEYDKLLEIVPFEYEKHYSMMGINETCLRQYEIAKSADDVILFEECDYIYRPDTGAQMERAISELKLVSPYNHLNFYLDESIHSKTCTLELVDNEIYRTTERNTMTFGVTPELFRDHFDIFVKYGYLDNDVWHDLRDRGHPLYVPIPSIATHMVEGYLAPQVDWRSLWNTLL